MIQRRRRILTPDETTMAAIAALPASSQSARLVTAAGAMAGLWKYDSDFSSWVPHTIDLRGSAAAFAGLVTDRYGGGGSTYAWGAGGIAMTGHTRISIDALGSIARSTCEAFIVAGVFKGIALGGALGAASRPRWCIGVRCTSGDGLTGGIGYSGAAWQVANEYGAGLFQSTISVPGFAVGANAICGIVVRPKDDGATTFYMPFAMVLAATGELDAWVAGSADALVFDWPITELQISCLDSDLSTTPGATLTEIHVIGMGTV